MADTADVYTNMTELFFNIYVNNTIVVMKSSLREGEEGSESQGCIGCDAAWVNELACFISVNPLNSLMNWQIERVGGRGGGRKGGSM